VNALRKGRGWQDGGVTATEAIIVAGGFGTRLLPLTERRPKHLLNVGGVPFLTHQLTKLAAAGIEHVVMATSYKADAFVAVLGDGERYGVHISYVREEVPLGTGGALRNVASALADDPDAPIVILNGDVLSGHSIPDQLADFDTLREGRLPDVSLHLVEVPDARAFGCVPTDAEGRVTAFVEKSDTPATRQINAGCYVFRRRVLDTIPEGREVSVERETFPGLIADGALIVGYVENAYWRDVGTPEALVAASRDVVTGVAPRYDGGLPADRIIDSGALVGGEVSDGSVVEEGAVIESGARVEGSIVMAHAHIGRDARVTGSVIGPEAYVGPSALVEGAALGDAGRVPADAVVAAGARVGCEETFSG
jgi:mannose-1-phosphate guanylyltransferase